MKRFWECDLGYEMDFQPNGWESLLWSRVGKGSERALLTLGSVFWGEAIERKQHGCTGGILGQHTGVPGIPHSLHLHLLQPRHAVVQPLQCLWNKVSANKGPFHELQAGPLSATKKAIEIGSQENSLLWARGFVPTSRARIMTTPSLWLDPGW